MRILTRLQPGSIDRPARRVLISGETPREAALTEPFNRYDPVSAPARPSDIGEYDSIGHIASVEASSPSDVAAMAGGNAKRLVGL